VLSRLDPVWTMLARVGKPWLAVVLANNLPRAGQRGAVKLKLVDFVRTVKRLAWAKDNGGPWLTMSSCEFAAKGGCLEVLQWAREQSCEWDWRTMDAAAGGGHLEVLRWAWEHDCPHKEEGNYNLCEAAAAEGHIEVLLWALEQHGCDWDERTCARAAAGGHLAGAQTRPLFGFI